MGQAEVFEWLKKMRLTGDENWFYPKEIEKGLRREGFTNGVLEHVRGDCFALWQGGNGCLEMRDFDRLGITNYKKAFRIKKKYCEAMRNERV